MNRNGRSDVILLLAVLLGFSASMAVLVSNIHSKQRNEATALSLPEDINDETAKAQIAPLLYAHAIDHVAQQIFTLAQSNAAGLQRLASYAIDPINSPLDKSEKALLLVALLFYAMKTESSVLPSLVAWITKQQELFKDLPFLLVTAESPYNLILQNSDMNTDLNKIIHDPAQAYVALKGLINLNDYEGANTLYDAGLRVSKDQATNLLHQVVSSQSTTDFIPFFIKLGANINGFLNGKTPLMTAIENENVPMAKMLLTHGAKPKLHSPNPAIGTAMQIALQKNNQAILNLFEDQDIFE
jgi:hypothetical protein